MKTVVYLVVAVALIGFGGYRYMSGSTVSDADRMRCEDIVRAEHGDSTDGLDRLIDNCDEPGMVAMMDSRAQGASAQQAAQSIATANRTDLVSMLINCALIGAGIGAAGAALGTAFGRKRV